MRQGFETRVDWVGMRLSGPPAFVLNWLARLTILAEEGAAMLRVPPTSVYEIRSMKSSSADGWAKAFEVWGPSADHVWQHLTDSDIRVITRIDWRFCIPEPAVGIKELEAITIHNIPDTRNSRGFKESPKRAKRRGRDAGGKSYTVGVKNGTYQTCYYQRKGEEVALEFRFAKTTPLRMYTRVKEVITKHGGAIDVLRSLYEAELQKESEQTIIKHTGLTLGHLLGTEQVPRQEMLEDEPEDMLTLVEKLYKSLNADQQAAFMSAMLDIDHETRYNLVGQRDELAVSS